TKEFTILYPFNEDSIDSAGAAILTESADAARKASGSVKVTAYRGASLLSNGERLIEKPGIAEKRAQTVASFLNGLGISKVTVEFKDDSQSPNGQSDPARRRVTIVVGP